jgi:hypothetical protein
MGLEKHECGLGIAQIFLLHQKEFLENKNKANSLIDFLFVCVDTDGKIVQHEFQKVFLQLCVVLKKYLIGYQSNIGSSVYQNIIRALNLFPEDPRFDLNTIKELQNINSQTANAWRANANSISLYIQKIRKRYCIEAYCVIAE